MKVCQWRCANLSTQHWFQIWVGLSSLRRRKGLVRSRFQLTSTQICASVCCLRKQSERPITSKVVWMCLLHKSKRVSSFAPYSDHLRSCHLECLWTIPIISWHAKIIVLRVLFAFRWRTLYVLYWAYSYNTLEFRQTFCLRSCGLSGIEALGAFRGYSGTFMPWKNVTECFFMTRSVGALREENLLTLTVQLHLSK